MKPLPMFPITAVLSLLCSLLVTVTAKAGVVAIDSVASSFFYDTTTGGPNGFYEHGTSVQNYQVGYNSTTDENTRNWFIFEIPPLAPSESIGGATVSFYMPVFPPNVGFGYDSHDAMEEFALFGLSATASTFISAALILDDDGVPDDGPLFDMWWPEVEAGPELGSAMVSKADEGGFVTVDFTPLGLAVLTAAAGGDFLMGGAVPSLDDGPTADLPEGFFHHTHPYGIGPPGGETTPPELLIDIVPEPSSLALVGLGALAFLQRRSRV